MVPSAATNNTTMAISSVSCVTIPRISAVAFVPAILRPLPNIAVNIVKSPRIRLEAVDWHSLPAIFALRAAPRVQEVSVIVCLVWCDCPAPPERCRSPRPCHVLALGLRQQLIGFARLPRQPLHIGFGVRPGDTHNRVSVVLCKARRTP